MTELRQQPQSGIKPLLRCIHHMAPSNDIAAFRAVLKDSKSIVVVAAADLSTASGIPIFKDGKGQWKTHDLMDLVTPAAFAANPSLVWQFYQERREVVLKAKPSAAHYALALISNTKYLKVIAPSAKLTLITQCVDGLSIKAFLKACPGLQSSEYIYEIYGNLLDTLCTGCKESKRNTESPICQALKETSSDNKNAVREIPREDLPHCQKCGGLLRPGVVWFGETTPRHGEVLKIVAGADVALVVGTSTVSPAAEYAQKVAEGGGIVAVFNLQKTDGDDYAQYLFLGPYEETLLQVLEF